MFIPTQAGISCKWTNDSQRFLLEHFDAIHDSPPQIYHSALPFCPSSSWVGKCYAAELSQEVRVVKGVPAEWGTCSRTVSFSYTPLSLALWKSTVAVGTSSKLIVILNAITGRQVAIFSGHTGSVNSLVFSSDGISLISGSNDKTVKLWDVQTGGVVKTFYGPTRWVTSVSISADCSMIASGSNDGRIYLWNIQTRECHCIIEQGKDVGYVNFSPSDPQHLISASQDGTIQKWDIDGHQIGPKYEGSQATFSLDGTHLVSHKGKVVTVRNSNSGAIVAEFHVASDYTYHSCFSPNGRLIAVAASGTVYVWDITGSDPLLVGTFAEHTSYITSVIFSSSLISASKDNSIKFWQISALTDPVATDFKSTPLVSAPIKSISLQANDGFAVSSDSDGVVNIWDLSTGFCRTSFQTPAKGSIQGGQQLIDSTSSTFVWWANWRIHIWDIQKSELLQTINIPGCRIKYIKISGDGSKVFYLDENSIKACSQLTGEVVGEVKHGVLFGQGSLTVDGSRVWVHFPRIKTQGWDFGTQGTSPVQLHNTFPGRPRLHFVDGTRMWQFGLSRFEDTATGKEILRLAGRFAKPLNALWDGQYLVAGYETGEVLILDFHHVLPSRAL